MDQITIGKFIAKKRKEKGFTQAQLAERLGVSDKTVSKWECGRCMPDYSVIEALCEEIGVSMATLMDGKESEEEVGEAADNSQIVELIKRIQLLEHQKTALYGIIMLVMGMAIFIFHYSVGGTQVRDFISGFLVGLSITEMLLGIFVTVRGILRK